MEPTICITPQDLLGPLNHVEQKHAPANLYLAGSRNLFTRGARVAVIGTRKPSADGMSRARVLTRRLVERGMVAVSGLAEGIDAVVHTTAIDANGRTMAVIGTGLDVVFPWSNRALQARIAADHAVVSQFPAGTPPARGNFPQRNRTMALLCDATIIVEAGETSGTQYQGWEALRLGRPLFLLESLVSRSDVTWPAAMVGHGAQVLSRDNLDIVLDAMPMRVPRDVEF